MKKLFVSISGAFGYLFYALPVLAATPVKIDPCMIDATGKPGAEVTGIAKILCGLGGAGIAKTIQGVVVFFIILAFVIALIYLLLGGVKWITSSGEKEKVDEARKHIVAALIGLVVVFLAVFLISVILAAFGVSWTDLQIPVIGQ